MNSNKMAAMTGISPNASGAAGRRGACVQLKLAEAATRPHTARRGARPDSARAARRVSSTAHTPAAPSRAKNSRYGHGPRRAHVVAGEPGQALGGDPGRHAREPAEQHVLGGRRCRLPRTRVLAGHRQPLRSGMRPGPIQRRPRRAASARQAAAVPGRAAALAPLAARRSGGRCRLPSPSTTFKLTNAMTDINSG